MKTSIFKTKTKTKTGLLDYSVRALVFIVTIIDYLSNLTMKHHE